MLKVSIVYTIGHKYKVNLLHKWEKAFLIGVMEWDVKDVL